MLVFAVLAGQPQRCETDAADETLLLRVGQGDMKALGLLYEQTKGAVFAYALSLLRRRDEAEDVTQETFLKIRAAAHLYRPEGKPLAWILTITGNLCRMQLRKRMHELPMPEEREIADDEFDGIADAGDRMVLQAALRVLSDDECRIIVLHAVSGFKHREIGELLSLPLPTVLSKYSRGLKKLRRELEGAQ